jgi:hypothetical protein
MDESTIEALQALLALHGMSTRLRDELKHGRATWDERDPTCYYFNKAIDRAEKLLKANETTLNVKIS